MSALTVCYTPLPLRNTGYTLFVHKLSCLLRQLSKAAEKKSCAYAEAVTTGEEER